MKLIKRICILFSILLASRVAAQNPVNSFANVTGIAGTILSVNAVNETYDTFEDGEYIIIMQMQDDVIGANTTNASTFGNLGSIQSAGLFEIAEIASHTEAGSLPNTITLAGPLANTYHINTNASVQIISFRFLGTNYTTSSDIGTVPWNGTTGGVTAISVTDVLTLAHSISANGCGFAGGIKNTPNGYSGCDNSTYISTLSTRYAGKGTGIYKSTTAGYGAARGKILNGGGGGNDVNGGGGGGGNFTSGGGGGSGWTPAGTGCSPIVGGLGGLSLSGSISGSQIFMGGGGGSGHENDGVGTAGGKGGGIILIKTGTLVTSTCAGIGITANGISAVNSANDGAGGGGAGGSVILNANVFSVAGTCLLTVSANGGNGGNSNAGSSDAHGGGGGGGQGVIIYPSAQPATNITSNTIPGTAGSSCGSCGSGVNGSAGSGTSNSGIIVNATGPLPIDLLSFEAHKTDNNHVLLEWRTAVEENSKEFILQRMKENDAVTDLAHIPTKGNNSNYTFTDAAPGDGINYYRLKEIAIDGAVSSKSWIEVDVSRESAEEIIVLYPNPVKSSALLLIYYTGDNSDHLLADLLDNTSGKVLRSGISNARGFTVDISGLAAGAYTVRIMITGKIIYKKLIILN